MSARVEKTAAVRRTKPEEIIVDFEAERLKAPFLLRCGALIIDYVLFISIPVVALLIGRFMGDDGAKLLDSQLSNVGWLIAVLIGLTNFILLPMFTCQSIGKMLTGLSVVRTDGRVPTFGNLLLRHFIGYPLTLITGGLGFLVSVVNTKGRALHDFIAGTVVIYGQKRRR
jgi:uncharacterized RDD family membrane protein YckC